MIRIAFICWTLTALSALSICAYAMFDTSIFAPIGADFSRYMLLMFIHLMALGAGPMYESFPRSDKK